MMPHSAPSEGEGPSPPAPASPEEPQDLTEGRPPEQPPTSAEDGGEGKAATASPQDAEGGKETAPAQGQRRAAAEAKPPPRPSVVVRYGLMGSIGEFRHNLDPPPGRGTNVVLRTERGVELGQVVTLVGEAGGYDCISPERLREFTGTNGPDYPFRRDGRVLRLANPQDVIDYRHLEQSAREAAGFCRQQMRELSLEMRLVTVEHLLGGERLVFYFAAEQRVDFRELVRRLAGQYRTRIEMRQVGARDEARLVGDYERCGQQCCCQRFLKYLKPVSMRMAKTQKATLDPSKISGRCGRLMCCLRYEDETYEDLRKKLPRKNTWVATKALVGRVIETQTLTQLVRVQLPDNSRTVVAVDDIVERDVEPPSKPEIVSSRAPAAAPAPAVRKRAPQADRKQAPAEAAPAGPSERSAGQEGEPAPGRKRRRRRRPRHKQAEAQGKAAQPAEREPAKASGGGEGDSPKKAPPKRRSRRRRGGREKKRRQK